MATKRKVASGCIPGLTPHAYIDGGAVRAETPTLLTSQVDDDGASFSFTWRASGSSTYTVTAQGLIKLLRWEDGKHPVYGGLSVSCSCPSGFSMKMVHPQQDGKVRVCKHGGAALRSVHDAGAIEELARDAAIIAPKKQDELALIAQQKVDAQLIQEQEMPGERARIENGLRHLSPANGNTIQCPYFFTIGIPPNIKSSPSSQSIDSRFLTEECY